MKNPTLFQISEIKISYWPGKMKRKDRPKIKSSDIAFDILHPNWDDIAYRESFGILLLDRANQVLGLRWISQGGQAGTVADPKMIFQAALKANSSSLILAHNHPSGNLKPSQNDIDLTKKLKGAGQLLDISVLDHLILGPDGYYSFADEGLM